MSGSLRTFFVSLVFVISSVGMVLADGVVLTVSGEITKTNRGPLDAFTDILFSSLGVEFPSAYELTLDDLQNLPQAKLTTKYANWGSEVEVSGPTLKDVLAKVGAHGSTVTVRSVDGYAPVFDLLDIDANMLILATSANGKLLGIGGRGPIWLVFPPNIYEGQPEDDRGLAWAIINIEVE
jgi:hypothetical protein